MPRFAGMRLAIKFPPPQDTTPPRFLSSSSGSVVENQTLSFTVTNDEKCTIAITGGADSAHFEFVSGSSLAFSHVLRWASNGTKDFEAPTDANTDNAYVVQVTATDESGTNAGQQTITITVTDDASTAGQPIGLLLTLTKAD